MAEIERDRSRDNERDDARSRSGQEMLRESGTYYRDDYGWVMSDEDVAGEKEIEQQYLNRAAKVKAQIAKADKAYRQEIASRSGQVGSAYDSAIAKARNPDYVPVNVVSGSTIEHTYMLPKATVNAMNTKSFNTGDGSYVGNWVNNGKAYNIDTRVTGTGGRRGKELHEALIKAVAQDKAAQSKVLSNLEQQRSASVGGFTTAANKSYAGQKAVWEKELKRVQSAYGNRLKEGRKMYEASKARLNDSIADVNIGLLETPTNQVKTV